MQPVETRTDIKADPWGQHYAEILAVIGEAMDRQVIGVAIVIDGPLVNAGGSGGAVEHANGLLVTPELASQAAYAFTSRELPMPPGEQMLAMDPLDLHTLVTARGRRIKEYEAVIEPQLVAALAAYQAEKRAA